ncbi:MAG: hypothetical protein IJZ82_10720 [Lachnospiraceae bacterium]|nr:hypothetical protein [Lachnospiraceae bacterium]
MIHEIKNQKYYCDTFLEVHAPEELSRKVMNMKKQNNKKLSIVKKLAVTAASLAALFLGSNAITYAATGEAWVKGFFKDVQRLDGAVIGTEYVTIPGEIEISAAPSTASDDALPIQIRLIKKDTVPFKYLENMALGDVTLNDKNGDKIDLTATELSYNLISDGTITLTLSLPAEKLQTDQAYTLSITSLYGASKGDAPLKILGNWSCEFTYQ